MGIRSLISVERVSYSDDFQRCVGWSTALAAPQRATSVTLLLAILEAGAGTRAQKLLVDAGVTTEALEPLELATRASQRAPKKGLRRLARLPLGMRHSADMERVLQRANQQGLVQGRAILTTDDLLLALLIADAPAKHALDSLGLDPGTLRGRLVQLDPPPSPPGDSA
jgi:hypothetical protein